jgi:regulator of RNase E activity RraA
VFQVAVRGSTNYAAVQERLYSAVIADVLDDLGYREQAMGPEVRPLDPSFRILGRALTVLAADVYEQPADPYEKELAAVDALTEGDVLVATTNGSKSCGFWGELLSTAAASKAARGAVVDGFTRDSAQIVEIGFPVFATGYSPLDSKGRLDVISYGDPIRCAGAWVRTGDLVFADRDGVVVIPEEVSEEAFSRALAKVDGEDGMRAALKKGMGVIEAYKEHGIL